MNVAFHELLAIALTHEAEAGRESPDARGAGRWAWTCVLAVASHGNADALPHYYPLASWEDAIVSIVLVTVWCLLVPRRMRKPLLIVCVAALLPDIVDHGPDDLRKHLGLLFPALPNLFPWHWPAGSGSWRGRGGPNWIVSLVNHVIAVAFCGHGDLPQPSPAFAARERPSGRPASSWPAGLKRPVRLAAVIWHES